MLKTDQYTVVNSCHCQFVWGYGLQGSFVLNETHWLPEVVALNPFQFIVMYIHCFYLHYFRRHEKESVKSHSSLHVSRT